MNSHVLSYKNHQNRTKIIKKNAKIILGRFPSFFRFFLQNDIFRAFSNFLASLLEGIFVISPDRPWEPPYYSVFARPCVCRVASRLCCGCGGPMMGVHKSSGLVESYARSSQMCFQALTSATNLVCVHTGIPW